MRSNLKMHAYLWVIGSMLLVTSCNKDETVTDELSVEKLTIEEVSLSDEADAMSEDVLNVVDDVYASDEAAATGKGYISDFLPDCVTVTTVETSTSIEKTIDFGDGCELRGGNVLAGIINLSYSKDLTAASKTMSVAFENFTFNDVAIEGSKVVTRVRSNENGNPQGNVTRDITATWPDGTSAVLGGSKTREWIEGFGTGFWGDNVFLITGNWTFTNRNGFTYEKEVLTPLRREWACRFIVSGVLQITRQDQSANLDFGDGTCDAFGTLTYPDGTSEEVRLRRFNLGN
ncbi:hypothetical protein [Spongiivirga citrea]|uniref:Lipoprotein n=1 Tax=Spongiivirga citrea TaxID=1481457 RepID=A0A6M0CKZ6_9FLAO|nr:hypothetical protein [Spongiivirga citrea]NER18322.1 hypothetical protein [Spongiivirga citrea]